MQSIRRSVVWIDERWWAGAIGEIALVHGGECFDPAVLREVGVVQPNAATQDRLSGRAELISEAEARRKCFPVIVGDSRNDAASSERWIHALVVAAGAEKPKRFFITTPKVHVQA